jgi:hypothetical protein
VGILVLIEGRQTLVDDRRESGNYQVALDELLAIGDSQMLVENVVALKSSWANQRQVDDLCRALRARWLVTTDPDDMRRCLALINSAIELVTADQPATTGQLTLVPMLRPG